MKKLQRQKPNILGIKTISFVAAFSCLFIFSPIAKVSAQDITAQKVIQLVNGERLSQGINALIENTVLDKAAKDKVKDMIKNDYFAHTSPSGVSPWHWIEKNGYDYKYAGENLAINFLSADSQQKAWMASPTHRKNILNPNYKEIGVAVAEGKVDGIFSTITVQMFGTQMVVVSRSPESAPALKETRVVQGEQFPSFSLEKNYGFSPVNLAPVPADLKISEIRPAEFKTFTENNNQEEIAWMLVIAVLIVSITFNAISLSRYYSHNPFIAANTVVLLMILTSVVMWRI